MNEVIRTSHLTKYYGKTCAVDDVSLSVNKGEIFGFLGLNGAGKTTTIRMLLGMIAPTSGECFLQGRRISKSNLGIWNEVGYMVETPYSYPELTVRENLELVRRLRGIRDKACVDWIMGKLKLEGYADRKAGQLSLGNAQRLGIAKAMIHKPKILILDEPTNGLDPAGIVEVRELLQDMAGNQGVTILVSSHKLDEISKIATNIAIIHYGRLIKEIDSAQLESQVTKTLIIDGRDRAGMVRVLSGAGYKVSVGEHLQLQDKEAVSEPEIVAELLVNAGYPPALLKVEKEDLEAFFLRTINEAGGVQ